MAITVNVVQFGKETPIELDEGATYGDVLSKIPNGRNLDVRSGGSSVADKKDAPVRHGERLTAAPRQVKQG